MNESIKKFKKLNKERTEFQRGYAEQLHTQNTYPKVLADIGKTVNSLFRSEDFKKGQDVGQQDARAALQYQAEQSRLETERQKEENKKRLKTMKVNK